MQGHFYKVLNIHLYASMGRAPSMLFTASVESIKSKLPREENCRDFVQAREESQDEVTAAEQCGVFGLGSLQTQEVLQHLHCYCDSVGRSQTFYNSQGFLCSDRTFRLSI
jgi:hypothetical protein